MTGTLLGARWTVAGFALLLPLAHAALARADGWPVWPLPAALAGGAALRALAGGGAVAAVLLAVAPVWQVLYGGPEVTLFQDLMPWMAFGAAGLARPRGETAAGPAWRAALTAWGAIVALAAPVVAARELDFSRYALGPSTLDAPWGFAPYQTAAFVLVTAEAQLLALLLFEWAVSATAGERRRAWRALVPGLVVAAVVAVWQQLVDPMLLSRDPWTRLHRAAGTLFDANAMGALLALSAPILAAPASGPVRIPAWLWAGAVWASALAGIIATGSRASLAAAGVALVLVVLRTGRPRHWLAMAVAAAGIAGVAAAFWAAPEGERSTGNAVGRLAGSVSALATGGRAAFTELLWTRDGYGPAARALIAEHPWTGGGVGAFGALVGDYATAAGLPRLPSDNAQNWWLHQLAEFGAAGALPMLAASLLAGLACGRAVRMPEGAGAAGALIVLGLLSLVSPPTQHPIIQVVIGLVVSEAVVRAGRLVRAGRPGASVGAAIWVLALACAGATAVEGARSLRPSLRAVRFQTPFDYGFDATETTSFGPGRWSAPEAAAVFAPSGRAVALDVFVPHDDVAASPVRVTISDAHGPVCTLHVHDHGPHACEIPTRAPAWMLVRLEVSRPWRPGGGPARGAFVNARFVP